MLRTISRGARRWQRVLAVFRDFGFVAVFQRLYDRVRRRLGVDNAAHALWLSEQTNIDAQFDARFGTATGGVDELFDLTIVGENARHGLSYIATRPHDFERVVSSLPIDAREYTFVDLGCGKGRVLLLASRYPFKHIVGVDFAKELIETAKRNIATTGVDAIELVLTDASNYELPDGPVIIYLFNPFGAAIVRKVGRNALASWRSTQNRPIIFVYMNPVHSVELQHEGWYVCMTIAGCHVLLPRGVVLSP